MLYNNLSPAHKAAIIRVCFNNGITSPDDIETAYNNYAEGRNILEGLSESYQRAQEFGQFLTSGGKVNRYDGETEPTGRMEQTFPWLALAKQEEEAYQKDMQQPYFRANGKITKEEWRNRRAQNTGQITEARVQTPVGRAITDYVREANYRAKNGELMLNGKYGLPIAGLAAGAATVAPAVLANPYVSAGINSAFGAHGIQSLANDTADWSTALELMPLAAPAKAVYSATKPFVGPIVEQASEGLGKARTFLGSSQTGKWTQFGDKEYRFEPGRIFEGLPIGEIESRPAVPEGWEFVKKMDLRTKDGLKTIHQIRNTETGKYSTLENLSGGQFVVNRPKSTPIVDLANYHGERLTGNEPGFDEWARHLTPETDHFANLSHGIDNPRELLPIINSEFEALPNGSRIDLGDTFSGDISANLLQYAYRNKDRIKMVLPKNLNSSVFSNNHGVNGAASADNFNFQLRRLLEADDYPYDIVPEAVYDMGTNRLTEPALSFIKLHRNGGKLYEVNI